MMFVDTLEDAHVTQKIEQTPIEHPFFPLKQSEKGGVGGTQVMAKA